METKDKECRTVNINGVSATRPDDKTKIVTMPQRPVLYFFNIG